ncbi:MAG: ShlB/FhaC/HecB family hemolysin secretion/activation protein [Desulfobacterales bacterium]
MQKILFVLLTIGLMCICGNAAGEDIQTEKNSLPPVEESGNRLSSVGKVYVNRFLLDGNTVFADDKLGEITAAYEQREITAEELQEAAQKITEYYVTGGYVNSGAFVPDQEVQGGNITIRIVEGKLSGISLINDTRLRERYILSRLSRAADSGKSPLNINRIQEHLKLLKDDPRIDNINASLKPGLERGEAFLEVEVDEARPYNVGLVFNNSNSPSIGAYRGELHLSHMNLTGWGDSLNLRYALTEGLDEYFGSYTIPLTRWGTSLALEAGRCESTVKASPFDILDIESETETYGTELRHPFYKTLSKELAAGLRFEHRKSETSLLNDGYAFSQGVEPDGTSRISVLRFSQEWVDRSMVQVIAARSVFNFGLDALDATIHDSGPDGEFFFWLGQFQWLRKFAFLDAQVLFRFDIRLSNDPLLPMEKFEIGGSSTVRGYRENQMTTDNGLIASLEWRIPVWHLKIPGLSKKTGDGLLQICPFYDYGKGWNTDMDDPSPDNLSSVGLGARWRVNEKINAQVYWGHALRDADVSTEYDLQDDGIHFEISTFLF